MCFMCACVCICVYIYIYTQTYVAKRLMATDGNTSNGGKCIVAQSVNKTNTTAGTRTHLRRNISYMPNRLPEHVLHAQLTFGSERSCALKY